MNCSSRANPSPYYQLYRNGNLFQNSSNGLFQVKEMDRSHGGDYKCVPVNMFGEGPVKTLTITVEGLYSTPILVYSDFALNQGVTSFFFFANLLSDFNFVCQVSAVCKISYCQPGVPGFNPRSGRGLNFGRPSFTTLCVGRDVRPLV